MAAAGRRSRIAGAGRGGRGGTVAAVTALAACTLLAGVTAAPAGAARVAAAAGTSLASAATSSAAPSAAPSSSSPPQLNSLAVGASLLSGMHLSATTGYTLVMQADGNLVEYGLGRALWSSRTHGAGATATMQPDGNLVIRSAAHVLLWTSGTPRHPGATVVLGTDGDLVLSGPHGADLWENQVSSYRLAPTGGLAAGQVVYSPDGGTTLTMGPDGNLVLRTLVGTARVAIWSTGTSGHPGALARMRVDGALVVIDAHNTVLWSSATGTPHPVHLSLQDGGNARIYDPASDLIASVGDDYPHYLDAAVQDSLVDPWGYYNRECVSFAAWRVLTRDKVTVSYAGNANTWAKYARRHGFVVDRRPAPGSVAWTNAGQFGHVAVVEKVVGAYLVVEEYNYGERGVYAHRVVLASAFKAFLHFERPAAPGSAATPAAGPGLAPAGYVPGR